MISTGDSEKESKTSLGCKVITDPGSHCTPLPPCGRRGILRDELPAYLRQPPPTLHLCPRQDTGTLNSSSWCGMICFKLHMDSCEEYMNPLAYMTLHTIGETESCQTSTEVGNALGLSPDTGSGVGLGPQAPAV
ncbi:hypothetical protein STEG23_026461 [Scotinomys teguina]